MPGQDLRPSQYLFSYGVGSILETREGPMIIQSIDMWDDFSPPRNYLRNLDDYEIEDRRASSVLDNAKFFRLPTNAELRVGERSPIIKGRPFPEWGLCMRRGHQKLFKIKPNGKTRCPECSPDTYATSDAVRFVRACSNGHLYDVDWSYEVHGGSSSCNSRIYEWIEEGNSLDDITIECTECSASTTLGRIYQTERSCFGEFQENGDREDCDRKSQVILRNASYLRIPEIVSFLTIQPVETKLHLSLSRKSVQSILINLEIDDNLTADLIRSRLNEISRRNRSIVSPEVIERVESVEDEELLEAAQAVVEPFEGPDNETEAREQELAALVDAVHNGAPPRPTKATPTMEVEKGSSEQYTVGGNKIKLRITPVKRLRVVSIQTGYRRLIGGAGEDAVFVPTYYEQDGYRWYVGLEMMGEGVFIDFPEEQSNVIENSDIVDTWMRTYNGISGEQEKYRYHPEFVWWHTLSHRIIMALGIDSGYSSASIRERVYFRKDGQDSKGGILLYVSQRGADGSLGGLIALVPRFERVLNSALAYVESCSNDPLCRERKHQFGSNKGAACYGCLLVSETSCEHRNLFLDRNILLETLN